MQPKPGLLKSLIIVITILIFTGCQKQVTQNPENLNVNNKPETNIKIVPVDVAISIAQEFNPSAFNSPKGSNHATRTIDSLPGNNTVKNQLTYNDHSGQPAFYVFNYENNAGFVFISADYNVRPVLAYIDNGEFKKTSIPPGFQDWINKTTENIEVVRKGLYDNSKNATAAWNRYLKQYNKINAKSINPPPDPCDPMPPPSSYTVGPLLPVTWGQECTYNDLCGLSQNFSCPLLCQSTRPVTGCVATAMAQIIRYWQFPANYNYAAMPVDYGDANVEQLMSDAGQSVNMQYGCESLAYGNDVPPALINTFHYASANRWSYTTTYGYSHVVSNLDNYWPVLLEGQDSDPNIGGHEWVCDGYSTYTDYICEDGVISETYLYFHMNWGWHELYASTDHNGWFAYDNWYIPGLNYNFAYSQNAVTEIHP